MNLKYINFAAQEKPIQFSSAKLFLDCWHTTFEFIYRFVNRIYFWKFSVECLFKMKSIQVITFQHSDRRLLKQSLAVV